MRACWALAVLVALAACAQNGAMSPAASASSAPAATPGPAGNVTKVKSQDGSIDGEIIGSVRPGSKFSRVQIGMGLRQVEDLIGQPNDTAAHITGKAFIPFYFGGDTAMTEVFYKGEGQLSFARANIGTSVEQLVRIVVNPGETGYAH